MKNRYYPLIKYKRIIAYWWKMPEFKILNNIIHYMEENGANYKVVSISIDEELVNEINELETNKLTIEQVKKAADKCLAHEWLKHTCMGDRYRHLQITPKGIGAARSKTRSEEIKASRGFLKKLSDNIDDHKGLLVVLGFLLALATFTLKFMGNN